MGKRKALKTSLKKNSISSAIRIRVSRCFRVILEETKPGRSELANFQPDTGNFKELFEASFHAYFEPMHRYAYTLLRNDALASDVVQATFMKWWETKTFVNGTEEAKRYLYTAVYRTALNAIRDMKTKTLQAEAYHLNQKGSTVFNDPVVATELSETIQNTIESLPEQCRIIFTMSRTGGKKYTEIATTMNLSVKTIETQMGKALRILRERLAEYLTDKQV